jgi:hypothetical protein
MSDPKHYHTGKSLAHSAPPFALRRALRRGRSARVVQGFNSCFWLEIAGKPANTDIESAPARGGAILEKTRDFGGLYCAAHCVIFETRKILRCYNGLREFLQTYRRQLCVAGGVLFGLLTA